MSRIRVDAFLECLLLGLMVVFKCGCRKTFSSSLIHLTLCLPVCLLSIVTTFTIRFENIIEEFLCSEDGSSKCLRNVKLHGETCEGNSNSHHAMGNVCVGGQHHAPTALALGPCVPDTD
jgi:hypothetical protein